MSIPSLLQPTAIGSFALNAVHHNSPDEAGSKSLSSMPTLEPAYLGPSGCKTIGTHGLKAYNDSLYYSNPPRRSLSLARQNSDTSIPMRVLKENVAVASSSVDDVDNTSDTSRAPLRLTSKQRHNGWIQFLTLCWCIYLVGWNDGSTGPLLPRIQEYYGVYTT